MYASIRHPSIFSSYTHRAVPRDAHPNPPSLAFRLLATEFSTRFYLRHEGRIRGDCRRRKGIAVDKGMRRWQWRAMAGAAFVALVATGCASGDAALASAKVSQAERAINEAKQGNAGVTAPLDLKTAEDKLTAARPIRRSSTPITRGLERPMRRPGRSSTRCGRTSRRSARRSTGYRDSGACGR